MNNAVGIVDRSMLAISRSAAIAKKAFVGIAGGLVAGLAAGGLASAIKQIADYGDNLRDLSIAIGTSVEQLSLLDFAASQSGASLEGITSSLGRLQKNLVEVANGGGEAAARALRRLNLDARELANTDLVTQLGILGDALNGIQNPSERAATAQALFGRGARAILPLLAEGAAGIANLTDRFTDLGGTLTKEQTEKFDALNDSLGELKTASRAAGTEITATLAPALTKLFSTLATAIAPETVGTELKKRAGELRQQIATIQAQLASGTLDPEGKSFFIPNIRLSEQTKAQFRKTLADLQGELKSVTAAQAEFIAGSSVKRPAPVSDALSKADEEAAKRTQRAAEQRAKAEAEAIRQLGARLNAEQDVTEAARIRYEIEQGAYQEFTAAGKERLNTLAAELDLQKESAEVSDYLRGIERQRREDAEAATQARNDDRRRTIESLRTPTEQYGDEVQRLLDLGLAGEDLARGIAKARESFESATTAVEDTTSAADELGLTFSSAFEDAIVSGNSLRDVITGLGQDILRIAVRKTVTEPLGNALSGLFSSSFGEGGGGFGSFFDGLFGNAKGGLYRVGGSGGGEMPVAFTARAGEVVAVGTGMEGGGGMHVVVNNYSNANVQTRERRNPNGRRELEVTIGELVQGNVAAGRTAGIGLVPPLVSR